MQSQNNVRMRQLAPVVARANELLAKAGELEPLPECLTPHSLRRTFATILVATGEDFEYVMGACGHTDVGLTLRIYAQQIHRRDGERERLKALVNGQDLAPGGTQAAASEPATAPRERAGDGRLMASNAPDLQADTSAPRLVA